MKIRNGFVSNSSSSCFVCNPMGDINEYHKDNKNYTAEEAKVILQKMLDFYNDILEENLIFEEVFGEIKIGNKSDLIFLQNWRGPWSEETVCNKLLIYSAEDNTIPYPLFELIIRKFNAERQHLG